MAAKGVSACPASVTRGGGGTEAAEGCQRGAPPWHEGSAEPGRARAKPEGSRPHKPYLGQRYLQSFGSVRWRGSAENGYAYTKIGQSN